MKEINIPKSDDDIDEEPVVDVMGKHGPMKSIKVDKDKLCITPSVAKQINKENKQLKIEAEMDINVMYDEYKKAYNKDLDLKRVPCVIARDTMMSGWGGAEGKNHYQVVLCADSTEAYNVAHTMQSKAKDEGLANIRTSFGIQLPRNASVSYNVGRYASAWNMGDSWYEKYDTPADKKQEDIDDETDEENDIDLENRISLLDIALSEIPTVGVEDWGKDDELLFTADTKIIFENLKRYEHEIPKYYYDNTGYNDWSNGIDDYLQDIIGVDPEDGESDNTYNWNAPLTHDVEFTIYEVSDANRNFCLFKGSIHRAGDVRGNYTTEFLLEFNSEDDCKEAIFEACTENCCNDVEIDGTRYVIEPNFFSEYVDIYNTETGENYNDVYCASIEELKEFLAKNEKTED